MIKEECSNERDNGNQRKREGNEMEHDRDARHGEESEEMMGEERELLNGKERGAGGRGIERRRNRG